MTFAAATHTGPAPAARLVDAANPLAGHALYVDPTSAAMAAAHRANPPSAELDAIANTPQAFWIDGAVPSAAISRYVNGHRPRAACRCNPSGRALGVPPTTATAGAHADAYLWVKHPGDSDGSCGRGEPGPGHFMNEYAIDLARAAHH